MMKTNKTKQGAASIYMVVVCALLFSVITAGFIVLMTNEMSKSSENNLSQSAYDASLVGIEDMKIAIQKYYECLAEDTSCTNKDGVEEAMNSIINASGEDKCKKNLTNLLKILHGINNDDYSIDNGVLVQETMNDEEDITQAYTCIDVDLNPTDYLATLTQSSPQRVIPLQAVGGNGNVKSVKISWYSKDNLGNQATSFNYIDSSGNPVFPNSDNASIPPVLAMSLYQTTENFTLSSLDSSTEAGAENEIDNRGTLWLVPSNVSNYDNTNTNYGEYKYESDPNNPNKVTGVSTILESDELTNSNNHDDSMTHFAYPVLCASSTNTEFEENYLCSVVINIPELNGRNENFGTFLLSLSLPYQTPDTDFEVEMYSSAGAPSGALMKYDQVQMIIDATGRANDIYARTESRVEFYDSTFPFPDYAMTLGKNSDGTSLQKTFTVTGESKCWSYTYDASKNNNSVEFCS